MNWRTILTPLLVLLLLLPLAWLLSTALAGHGPSLVLPQGSEPGRSVDGVPASVW